MSHYERYKGLGLLEPAENLLFGDCPYPPVPDHFVNINIEGLDSLEKVETGFKHVVAHIISKDTKVLDEIRTL